eukprot:scaffold24303_cov137-Cylindrotheca_fusiformis.AAC.1
MLRIYCFTNQREGDQSPDVRFLPTNPVPVETLYVVRGIRIATRRAKIYVSSPHTNNAVRINSKLIIHTSMKLVISQFAILAMAKTTFGQSCSVCPNGVTLPDHVISGTTVTCKDAETL